MFVHLITSYLNQEIFFGTESTFMSTLKGVCTLDWRKVNARLWKVLRQWWSDRWWIFLHHLSALILSVPKKTSLHWSCRTNFSNLVQRSAAATGAIHTGAIHTGAIYTGALIHTGVIHTHWFSTDTSMQTQINAFACLAKLQANLPCCNYIFERQVATGKWKRGLIRGGL